MELTGQQLAETGSRFQFGENWRRFLSVLNDERIAEAEKSLREMLAVEDLRGLSFLDIGSGSGLFSLAARRLGAARVHSFDYDPQSVACAEELKRRYFNGDARWTIDQGSVLDADYVRRLGQFDIVYSWGVLHHTGAMWQALENAALPVAQGGRLFIAIYNDQETRSRLWLRVKRFYCEGTAGKFIVPALFIPYFITGGLTKDLLRGRNPLARYTDYKKSRGMSIVHDWLDWLGGYPFEVARPEEIFGFYRQRGFTLDHLVTCGGGLGNNQFVFTRR
ncbi:MAG TPA: class I SAM-dependent methyltransferase [Pyrinomonadaceae bacterium]|jgi:2-polyprenyl-6-hydroxyphenyl methylase/3-demethylubiquinone-9 3-methyltransferase